MAFKKMLILLYLIVFSEFTYAAPLKVVFLGESSSDDAVWLYRVECMRQAAQEIGADFSFRFAEGDYARHAEMIEDAVLQGADAVIGPWWNSTIYNDAISLAVEQGVFVYGMLGIEPLKTLPESISEHLGWVETNWNQYGRELAKISNDYISDGSIILWPAEIADSSYITDAIQGFLDYNSEQGLSVYIQVLEVGFDMEAAADLIANILGGNPNIASIVTSGAIAISAANLAVKEFGVTPGDIPLFGQVASPEAVQGIRDGTMPAGVNLELTNSSYYAILDCLAAVKLGAAPRRSETGFITITKDLQIFQSSQKDF